MAESSTPAAALPAVKEITLEDVQQGRLPDTLADELLPELPEAVVKAQTKKGVQAQQNVLQARLRVSAIIGLRLQGYKRRQIAEMLGISADSVKRSLAEARKRGYLNDVGADLRADSLAMAVEGLNTLLAKKDKDAIFKTLEGLGEFKSYRNITGEQTAHGLPPLQVNILNAPVAAAPSNGVGKPRED